MIWHECVDYEPLKIIILKVTYLEDTTSVTDFVQKKKYTNLRKKNKTKKNISLLLNSSVLLVWTLISTLLSLIFDAGWVLHPSGIDIRLVKSSDCFVDLSSTPTQFLAFNFLITQVFLLKDITWNSNVQLQQSESLGDFYNIRPHWKPWKKNLGGVSIQLNFLLKDWVQ